MHPENDDNLKIDTNSFEVKDSRMSYLFQTITFTVVFLVIIFLLLTHTNWISVKNPLLYVTVLTLIGAIQTFFKFKNPKIILKINKQGIWTKKHGQIAWKELDYFYIKSNYTRGYWTIQLFFKFIDFKKNKICINLNSSTCTDEKIIRKYIEIYKGDYDLSDYGQNDYF